MKPASQIDTGKLRPKWPDPGPPNSLSWINLFPTQPLASDFDTKLHVLSIQEKCPLSACRKKPSIGTRAGHAYAKYVKYADYAYMRMRIENLIHIFHIQRKKTSLFKRQ